MPGCGRIWSAARSRPELARRSDQPVASVLLPPLGAEPLTQPPLPLAGTPAHRTPPQASLLTTLREPAARGDPPTAAAPGAPVGGVFDDLIGPSHLGQMGAGGAGLLLDDVPAVLTPARRRRSRPDKVDADRAYDHAGNRASFGAAGPPRGSPGVGSSHRAGWAASDGGSSGRCRGCRTTGGWGCGGIGVRSGGLRSCCWPVRLCASTGSSVPS
jgi:hypothetical protein